VKIVATADVHLHPYRVCSRDGGHDRLMDGLSVLRQSLELARKHQAVWLMCGDFKQPKTNWPQEALTGAHEVLRAFGDVTKVMVAGNHDARGQGGSGLAPFADVAHVVHEQGILELPRGGPVIACFPWDSNLDSSSVQKMVRVADLVAAHAFLQGIVIGPEDAHLGGKGVPIGRYGAFKVAVFGDIHKGQWRSNGVWTPFPMNGGIVREAGPWRGEVFYPGSPYQINWGERNDPAKGALVLDLETGEAVLHPLKAPRFIHIEVED